MDPTPQPPPTIEEARKLPPSQRIPSLGELRLVFPLWKEILDAMARCHEDVGNSPEPECMLLVGPTGAGKSTLARSYAQRFPRNRMGRHIQQPVLMVTVFPPPTEKTLASNLLATLGDPRATSGTAGAMTQRVVQYLCDCQVKMLIFDEIQHFFDRDNNKLLYRVSDWLKTLIKETRTACVLVGLQNRAEQIVYHNEQLAGLFGDPWILPAFIWEKQDTQKESDFQKLLFQLEQLLPFNEPSNLYELKLARCCYIASGGILRYLMKLIRRASTLALKDGKEHLDQVLLATAFNQSLRVVRRDIANPFEQDPPAEYKLAPTPEPGMPGGTSNRGQTPPPQRDHLKDVIP